MAIKKAPTAPQHPEHEALAAEARNATKPERTKKRINFEVDATLHRALKARASAQGETIADVLTRAINEYLSR